MCSDERFPRRPHIPITLYALIVVIAVQRSTLAEGACWMASTTWCVALALASVAMMTSIVLVKRKSPISSITMVVGTALVIGGVTACVAVVRGEDFVRCIATSPVSSWTFRIVGDPVSRNGHYRCRATAIGKDGVSGDVWLTLAQPTWQGAFVRCVGAFAENAGDEWGVTSRRQGVWGSVRATRILEECEGTWARERIHRLRQGIIDAIDARSSPERALLAGCVCGWREGLATFGVDEAFSRCGLSHLVAVSGSHIAILSAILTGVMESIRIRPRTRIVALVAMTGVFVLVCGSPPSAVRSWVMACAAHVGWMGGRRSHALSAVAVVGLCMALLNPGVSGQLGYTLSVSAVAGLCLLSPYASYAVEEIMGGAAMQRRISKWVPQSVMRLIDTCRESLAAALVAQVATLPFVIESFGEVSLVGPVASMVVTLPFSFLLGITMVGVACWWVPALQSVVFAIAHALAHVLLEVVSLFGRIPHATVVVEESPWAIVCASWIVMVALLVVWPRVCRRKVYVVCAVLLVLLCAEFLRWRYFAPARVCILDVGQGDAILVQQGDAAILVDAGPNDAVVQALARNHVYHLDAVVVTHLHDDHYGGISSLQGKVVCDHVLVAQGVASHIPQELEASWHLLTQNDVGEIVRGDVLHVGGFAMEVVWPWCEVDGGDNADSLELRLDYDQDGRSLHALLTGDAEKDETGEVLANGLVGDIDMLKLGHHGSEASITPEQAEVLDAEVAVASAGKNNSYGHPNMKCVETVEGTGALFLCTKDVGDVEILPAKEGVVVHTQRYYP